MRVLLTGGGSGGHITPLLAVAEQLKKIYSNKQSNSELKLFYLGPIDKTTQLFQQEDIVTQNIITSKYRRYFSFQNLIDFLKLPLGFLDALIKLYRIKPQVIFSKGGHGSFMVIIAGSLLKIPMVLHESDSMPGLTNRLLSKYVTYIATSFTHSHKYFRPQDKNKIILTGNPIRKIFQNQILKQPNNQIKKIFIMGGSQGSVLINNIIMPSFNDLLDHYEIIYQCGPANLSNIVETLKKNISSQNKNKYKIYGFINPGDLKDIYTSVDLIISRAGSGSIFEIAASGKPSILIPLTSAAQNHQNINADIYSQTGAAIVLNEKTLQFKELINIIDAIKEQDIQKMSNAARLFFDDYKNAATKIAELLLKIAK